MHPGGCAGPSGRTNVNRMSVSQPVRSVAEWLRERSDDELATLLLMRPDLVSPVPPDVGMLAARATTRSSVLRALDLLDRAEHGVLEALCLLPEPATFDELKASLTGELRGVDPAHVTGRAAEAVPRLGRRRWPCGSSSRFAR